MTPRPPLVLLHAFPLHSGLFADVQMPTDWPLFTPDRRGFGCVPLADDDGQVPEPDLAVLARDVLRFVDSLEIERIVIGGVSMGGYVSLAFHTLFPERVAGIVLAGTRSTADDADGRANRLAAAQAADAGRIASGAEVAEALLAAGADEKTRATVAGMADDASPESIAWAQRAMAARSDTTAALAAADVPTLIIVGDQDRVTPPGDAEHMVAAARAAQFVVIPGAGHLTPLENPSAFNQALGQWLTRNFSS